VGQKVYLKSSSDFTVWNSLKTLNFSELNQQMTIPLSATRKAYLTLIIFALALPSAAQKEKWTFIKI